jgi:ABC-type multidrug transport system ATPase subunit
MSSTEMAIRVQGLEKRFGGTPALRGLDLEVPTGQVTGELLWPEAAPDLE